MRPGTQDFLKSILGDLYVQLGLKTTDSERRRQVPGVPRWRTHNLKTIPTQAPSPGRKTSAAYKNPQNSMSRSSATFHSDGASLTSLSLGFPNYQEKSYSRFVGFTSLVPHVPAFYISCSLDPYVKANCLNICLMTSPKMLSVLT